MSVDVFASVYTMKTNTDLPEFQCKHLMREMPLPDMCRELIEKLLKDLKVTKSPGPDGIHPIVLKELAAELSVPLLKIFQSCINSGKIPDAWKIAHITPVFKKGDKCEPSNYRPISLTCIVSKILEKVIRDSLIHHLRSNELLSNKQYGFLKGRSAKIQMIRVMDDWTKHLDQGRSVDVIYLDFMKAFDKVSHEHLLHKLCHLGVHHQILDWIHDFLNERSQMVVYNNKMSSMKEVESGVPQGTVIGPSSFLSFVNDLPEVVQSSIYMFADDTKMFRGIVNNYDSLQLQSDIDRLVTWSSTWRLLFNPNKCKVMTVGRAKSTSNYTMTLYDGSVISLERSTLEKDLGILIDCQLNFTEHMFAAAKKANGIMGVIRRTFTHLDLKCFSLLYKSLVRPQLEYGVSVWFPHKMKDIEAIERVQKRATKQIKQIKHLSYSDRLKKLNLPTLRYRRHRGDMIEVFKILHHIYDSDVCEDILKLSDNNKTRGHSLKLHAQQLRLDIRKFSFAVRVVKPWNSLPEEVVTAPSVKAFEARLDKAWNDQPLKFHYKEDLML